MEGKDGYGSRRLDRNKLSIERMMLALDVGGGCLVLDLLESASRKQKPEMTKVSTYFLLCLSLSASVPSYR